MTAATGDVELLEQRPLYQGYFRLDQYRLRYRRFDGSWSRIVTREVLERGHAAALLPYDPACDRVLLIEQFRAGPYARGDDPWQLEVIAGIIDTGETPQEVARREALEEAGCEVKDALWPVAEFYMSPGAVSEYLYLYCVATDLGAAGGIHGVADEDEDIRVHLLPRSEAFALIETNKLHNSPAIIALQWLELNHARLRDAAAANAG